MLVQFSLHQYFTSSLAACARDLLCVCASLSFTLALTQRTELPSPCVFCPLAPSAVSRHMTADSASHRDTEQISAGASAITHTQTHTHKHWKLGEVRLVPGGRKQITHCTTHAPAPPHTHTHTHTHTRMHSLTSGSARVERRLFADLLLYCHSGANTGQTPIQHQLGFKDHCVHCVNV